MPSSSLSLFLSFARSLSSRRSHLAPKRQARSQRPKHEPEPEEEGHGGPDGCVEARRDGRCRRFDGRQERRCRWQRERSGGHGRIKPLVAEDGTRSWRSEKETAARERERERERERSSCLLLLGGRESFRVWGANGRGVLGSFSPSLSLPCSFLFFFYNSPPPPSPPNLASPPSEASATPPVASDSSASAAAAPDQASPSNASSREASEEPCSAAAAGE